MDIEKVKIKAKEIYDAFYDKVEDADIECAMYCHGGNFDRRKTSKECAIVAVDEILNVLSQYNGMHDQEFFDADKQFFKQVKKQIEIL
jgi:hypothetical protein